MKTLLILPIHLFKKIPLKKTDYDNIIIWEAPIYFGIHSKRKLSFNPVKLIYHRASCKYYHTYCNTKYKPKHITYVDFNDNISTTLKDTTELIVFDPVDHLMTDELYHLSGNKIKLTILDTPLFTTTKTNLKDFIKQQKSKKRAFFQTSFYIWQRKRTGLLMKGDKPLGDNYTYDVQNREKMPADIVDKIPSFKLKKSAKNNYLQEAKGYIKKHFAGNYGEFDCFLPFTHQDAQKWLKKFVADRLQYFGTYQDAIISGVDEKSTILYHSGIAAPLNIGLLEPMDVIKYVIKQGKNLKIGINNIEGFIRQILGWREQCRLTYSEIYTETISSNFFGHKRKLTNKWYSGELGILPVDECIKKAFKNGYLHHIERLMIVGQFMLLCEIEPDEVYRWFMEFSADSYDWVMIYNVYSMSQYADGGATTTKPYFSSSNYIINMSNYKKDGVWDKTWDALYWNFINNNQNKIKNIGRIAFQVAFWNKKSDEDKKELISIAKEFINKYTK